MIRVDTLDQLFATAMVLAHQPVPAGRRVAIVSNVGGPGILAADACAGAGLEVPELSAHTQARLRSVLSPNAAVANPVDCIASATAEQYRQALEIVLVDEAIDSLIVIFTPPLVTKADDVARAVASVAARLHQADRGELLRAARGPELDLGADIGSGAVVRLSRVGCPSARANRAVRDVAPAAGGACATVQRRRARARPSRRRGGALRHRTTPGSARMPRASCSVPIGSRTSRASAPPRAPGRLRRRPRSAIRSP